MDDVKDRVIAYLLDELKASRGICDDLMERNGHLLVMLKQEQDANEHLINRVNELRDCIKNGETDES